MKKSGTIAALAFIAALLIAGAPSHWAGEPDRAQAQALPPARFFGAVLLNGRAPPPASWIDAAINGKVCGQSPVDVIEGIGVGYALDVVHSGETPGCGDPQLTVVFQLRNAAGAIVCFPSGAWDNSRFIRLDLDCIRPAPLPSPPPAPSLSPSPATPAPVTPPPASTPAAAVPETPSPDPSRATLPSWVRIGLTAGGGAGSQPGKATFIGHGSRTEVIVEIIPGPSGASQAAHIHKGTCAGLGEVAYELSGVVDGRSSTMIEARVQDIFNRGLALDVHREGEGSAASVACGNIVIPAEPPRTGIGFPSGTR